MLADVFGRPFLYITFEHVLTHEFSHIPSHPLTLLPHTLTPSHSPSSHPHTLSLSFLTPSHSPSSYPPLSFLTPSHPHLLRHMTAGVSTLDIRTRLRITEAELAIVQREVLDLLAERNSLEASARQWEESWR